MAPNFKTFQRIIPFYNIYLHVSRCSFSVILGWANAINPYRTGGGIMSPNITTFQGIIPFYNIYLHVSRCSFSVLLGWANAIKMPDQHKYLKKRIFASYKMFRKGIDILILNSIILNYQFPTRMLADLCWSWILIALAHILIALAHISIALAHTLITLAHTSIALAHILIALTHPNSTEKLHRLHVTYFKIAFQHFSMDLH